jgi:WXG100 family type VII secretion target
MPATIRADTDQLRLVARQMRAASAQIGEQTDVMCNAMDALDATWSGSARERGMARWAQTWPRYRPAAEQLLRFAEQLDALAARLDEAARVFGDAGLAGGGGASGFGSGGPPSSMQDLAALVDDLYAGGRLDSQPIKFVQIGPDDYLVMLAGTEIGEGGNNWGASFMSGFGLPSAFEREVHALIAQHIPPGANLHFAAHSLRRSCADACRRRSRVDVAEPALRSAANRPILQATNLARNQGRRHPREP